MVDKIDISKVEFRSITDQDLDFLYQVYRSTRIDEMGIAHWPEEEKEKFLKSQFMMQHTQYMQHDSHATFELILLDYKPIGRLYIHWGDEEIRIIDLALLKEYRHHGIGSLIFRDLIQKSEEEKIPLSLYVEYYNFAKSWYEKLGFQEVRQTGVYYFMERIPVQEDDK